MAGCVEAGYVCSCASVLFILEIRFLFFRAILRLDLSTFLKGLGVREEGIGRPILDGVDEDLRLLALDLFDELDVGGALVGHELVDELGWWGVWVGECSGTGGRGGVGGCICI